MTTHADNTANTCLAGGPGCTESTCDTVVNAGPMGTWTAYRTCPTCLWVGPPNVLQWVTADEGFQSYPAATNGPERWNGWMMPSFAPDTAERIVYEAVTFSNQVGLQWTAEWTENAVTITDDTGDHTYEKNPDGTYSIGQGWWSWELE